MATVEHTLDVTFKPAFHALISCAEEIAAARGNAAALQWAERVLKDDFELFCHVGTSRRPALRLIRGGLDAV